MNKDKLKSIISKKTNGHNNQSRNLIFPGIVIVKQ